MAIDPNIKILLVEDAGTMRKMEIRLLTQLGFTNIVEAVDGNDAIEKLGQDPPTDLIISDWAMPNKDGLELLLWVRQETAFKGIPFLMATGHGDKEYTQKAMDSGADGVVAKPFTPDDLLKVMERAFGIEQAVAAPADDRPKVSDAGKVHLKMAHIQITDHLTLGVAKHMIAAGEAAPAHFELETRCLPGWNPVQAALENGDVDGAFILAPTAMDLFSYDVPIKLVLLAHKNGSIMVRTAAEPYKEPYPQFFKHKRFFIPHKMSIHNMLSHMYFTKMGLKPGVPGKEAVNVLFDVVPPIQMPAFMKENPETAGFMVAEPIGSRAIAAGIAEQQILSSELWENHPCCVAVFRDEFIRDYPDAVQEFVDLLIKAGLVIRDDPEKAAGIAVDFLDPQKELGLKPELLQRVLSDPKGIRTDDLYPVKEDLEVIQQYMSNKMGIGRTIDLDAFLDMRFADAAYQDAPAAAGKAVAAPAAVNLDFDTHVDRGGKYLIFNLGKERFGLSILDVREIVGMRKITPLPQLPGEYRGVINLRDSVIPVMDMRAKFSMETAAYHDRTCIIIVEISGLKGSTLIGCVVDSVAEVFNITDDQVEDAPIFGGGVEVEYILGMAKADNGVVILLEIDRVMHTEETLQLAS